MITNPYINEKVRIFICLEEPTYSDAEETLRDHAYIGEVRSALNTWAYTQEAE